MLEIGLRVIRGPDWTWGAQDDGEGRAGTVVEFGKQGKPSPDKTVFVQWDCGYRTNYRTGYDGAYDLRVIDNAQIGTKHKNIICDGCQKPGILGMRFKCTECTDYDLCTKCYMSGIHSKSHIFHRFDTQSSIGVALPSRESSADSRIPIEGIFLNALVVRGSDWEWDNQDGGAAKSGIVVDISGWDNDSFRSVASVTWPNTRVTNVYRVGHKGKVDLKYHTPGLLGYYYKDHLPVLGQEVHTSTMPRGIEFEVGDKVKVDVHPMHHRYNETKYKSVNGQIGTIKTLADTGEVIVEFQHGEMLVNSDCLDKVLTYSPGDSIIIRSNTGFVKYYQKGHGEWSDEMSNILGKPGIVKTVYEDGDLRVAVSGSEYTLNPKNVFRKIVETESSAAQGNNKAEKGSRVATEKSKPETKLENSIDKFIHEAAKGNLHFVRSFVQKFPNRINEKSEGKTCLQVAAHQGHIAIINLLMNSGVVDVEIRDYAGDTALHYATFGNQSVVINLLVTKFGADVNAVNDSLCTAMHIAVSRQHVSCLRVLLTHGCNPNLQDNYGDTPLHDAISKGNTDVIQELCKTPSIDFEIQNVRGFNALHHAALKGNIFATKVIMEKASHLVNNQKSDGFTPLHLATLNNHVEVVRALVEDGNANINMVNGKSQTPLMLAITQGHSSVIEYLVEARCSLNIADEDGDTAMHVAIIKMLSAKNLNLDPAVNPHLDLVTRYLKSSNENIPEVASIPVFLACFDIDINKPNRFNLRPLESVPKDWEFGKAVVEEIKKFRSIEKPGTIILYELATKMGTCTDPQPGAASIVEGNECMVCSETYKNVKFLPCKHRIACAECAARMKKCLKCNVPIESKMSKNGKVLSSRDEAAERLKHLESRIAEIEENNSCPICMERRRNVLFLCGHGSCEVCAKTLKICHMCRKAITKKIPMY